MNKLPSKEMMADQAKPALLVLDGAYTLETLRTLGNESSVTCRDLGGFFRHVWNVHPLASLTTSPEWASRYGKPDWHELAPRHTFVEGKIGRFAWLARVFPLNFAIAQIGLFLSLLALIRREHIAIVRVGDPLYLGLFGWALAKLGGAKLAIRVNGNNAKVRRVTNRPLYPQLFRIARVEDAVERFVLPRAALVMAPNQDNLDFALAQGANPSRGAIVSFGSLIDARHFADPAARPDATADLAALGVRSGRFLLTVGRLLDAKYPDHAILVLERLRVRGHDVTALLVGEGEMRDSLLALASERGVADHLVLAGNRDQGLLARIAPHAAVVLSPSTGRALSEVALAAAPVVAYDTDWQREIIETGSTGALVAYRDWEAMADAAERFVADSNYARTMGAALRVRALAMLDPTAGIEQERALYRRIFEKRGK